MPQCMLCQTEITAENDTEEHLVPQTALTRFPSSKSGPIPLQRRNAAWARGSITGATGVIARSAPPKCLGNPEPNHIGDTNAE